MDLGKPAFSVSWERIREWSQEGQWLWRDPPTGRASSFKGCSGDCGGSLSKKRTLPEARQRNQKLCKLEEGPKEEEGAERTGGLWLELLDVQVLGGFKNKKQKKHNESPSVGTGANR